jgi:hypothetical protein
MRGLSSHRLLAETTQLAYHLHWPLDTILDLEHHDRRRFLAEVERLEAPREHMHRALADSETKFEPGPAD